MIATGTPDRPLRPPSVPANWWGTLAGILPFLAWPVIIALAQIIGRLLQVVNPGDPQALQLTGSSIASWVTLLVMVIMIASLAAAWVAGWPRWSFPYLGLQLALSLMLTATATPGLRIFGYTFTSGELWGWRAWIPQLIGIGIGLIITRSFKPARMFFKTIGQDWTRLSFLLYGLLPVALVITFDEVRSDEWIMILLGLALTGGALGYLRASRPAQRFLLLAGTTALVWASAAVYLGVYWNERKESWMTMPGDGWQTFFGTLVFGLILVLILALPGLASLLKRPAQPAGTGPQ
jgi:hypothetical protein